VQRQSRAIRICNRCPEVREQARPNLNWALDGERPWQAQHAHTLFRNTFAQNGSGADPRQALWRTLRRAHVFCLADGCKVNKRHPKAPSGPRLRNTSPLIVRVRLLSTHVPSHRLDTLCICREQEGLRDRVTSSDEQEWVLEDAHADAVGTSPRLQLIGGLDVSFVQGPRHVSRCHHLPHCASLNGKRDVRGPSVPPTLLQGAVQPESRHALQGR
jgi:hypothetical protein